ncbi:hypothetical protein SMA5143A_2161 [Streptomyces sp. MA5143a]|nr:hypothetical protein SMA5143A_2161 [Streptomyces sp. MA5143a]
MSVLIGLVVQEAPFGSTAPRARVPEGGAA